MAEDRDVLRSCWVSGSPYTTRRLPVGDNVMCPLSPVVGGDEMSHNAYSTALVNGCLVLQRGMFAGLTVLVSGVCGLSW